jgi:hypothetical protein
MCDQDFKSNWIFTQNHKKYSDRNYIIDILIHVHWFNITDLIMSQSSHILNKEDMNIINFLKCLLIETHW